MPFASAGISNVRCRVHVWRYWAGNADRSYSCNAEPNHTNGDALRILTHGYLGSKTRSNRYDLQHKPCASHGIWTHSECDLWDAHHRVRQHRNNRDGHVEGRFMVPTAMKRFLFILPLLCSLAFGQGLTMGKATTGKSTWGPGVAGGPTITFDAVSSATPITTGTSISWTHTGTCSSNCVLLVAMYGDGNAMLSTVACTYNSVSMTKLYAVQDAATVYGSAVFVLALGSSVGSHTVNCTSSVAISTVETGAATSWGGVSQATPNRTVTNASGPGTASPVTVTAANSQNGDTVVAVMQVYGSSSTIASGNTSRYLSLNVSATNLTAGMSSASATGASQVMNFTGTPDSYWNIGAIPLIP